MIPPFYTGRDNSGSIIYDPSIFPKTQIKPNRKMRRKLNRKTL